MNDLVFTGKITKVKETRSGEGQKGEWSNTSFEVTESSPQNESYPQISLFDFFKNGEYVKYAKNFGEYYKLGDEVNVHFNFKRSDYINKEGKDAEFYKCSCWKLEKVESQAENNEPPAFVPVDDNLAVEDKGDLPF